ncbi:hypothetical protein CDIK_2583 [Cucumispora dikerogammari]|nr:hypothetical protein CDIK_2583 [Cucumispora dikerogammari]
MYIFRTNPDTSNTPQVNDTQQVPNQQQNDLNQQEIDSNKQGVAVSSDNVNNNQPNTEVNTSTTGTLKKLFSLYALLIVTGGCETFIDLFDSNVEITPIIKNIFVILYTLCALFVTFIGINFQRVSSICFLFLIAINSNSYLSVTVMEKYNFNYFLKNHLLKTTALILLVSFLLCFLLEYFAYIFYLGFSIYMFFKLYQNESIMQMFNGMLGDSWILKGLIIVLIGLLFIYVVIKYFIFLALIIMNAAVGSVSSLIGIYSLLYTFTNSNWGKSPTEILDLFRNWNKLYFLLLLAFSVFSQYMVFCLILSVQRLKEKWVKKPKELDKQNTDTQDKENINEV